jgi:hypothetical protein
VLGPQPDLSKVLDLLNQLGQLDTLLHCWLSVPPCPVLWLLSARLRQLRMVVTYIKPLGFLVLV